MFEYKVCEGPDKGGKLVGGVTVGGGVTLGGGVSPGRRVGEGDVPVGEVGTGPACRGKCQEYDDCAAMNGGTLVLPP